MARVEELFRLSIEMNNSVPKVKYNLAVLLFRKRDWLSIAEGRRLVADFGGDVGCASQAVDDDSDLDSEDSVSLPEFEVAATEAALAVAIAADSSSGSSSFVELLVVHRLVRKVLAATSQQI